MPTLVDIKSTLKMFSSYPLISMPMAILNGYYHLVPIIFLTTFYSATEVAVFFLVHRFIGSPTALLGSSLSNVLLKIFQSWVDGAGLRPLAMYFIVGVSCLCRYDIPFLCARTFLSAFVWKNRSGQTNISSVISVHFIRFVVSPLTMVLPAIGRVGLGAVKLPSFLILAVFVIFVCDRSNFTLFVFQYVSLDIALYLLYYMLCLTVAKQFDNSRFLK